MRPPHAFEGGAGRAYKYFPMNYDGSMNLGTYCRPRLYEINFFFSTWPMSTTGNSEIDLSSRHCAFEVDSGVKDQVVIFGPRDTFSLDNFTDL